MVRKVKIHAAALYRGIKEIFLTVGVGANQKRGNLTGAGNKATNKQHRRPKINHFFSSTKRVISSNILSFSIPLFELAMS
jgi:hypothetical protein